MNEIFYMKIAHRNKERQIITYGCFVLLVICISAYMYFVCASVVQVVIRKDTLQDISQLRSEIAFLESSYIEANYQIGQKVALHNEFTSVKDKIFINKQLEQGLVIRTTNE